MHQCQGLFSNFHNSGHAVVITQITINDRLGALLDQKALEAGITRAQFAAGIVENYLMNEAKAIFETKLSVMSLGEKESALGEVDKVRQALLKGDT